MSALTLSNDTREGRLLASTVLGLAERDRLDLQSREKLRDSIEFLERRVEGYGFCLSSEGDLLSQWRGYANDACGVSIGFRSQHLKSQAKAREVLSRFAVSLDQVHYDRKKQEEILEPTYCELRKLISEGAFRNRRNALMDPISAEQILAEDELVSSSHRAFIERTLDLFPILYTMKDSAFSEEREWRLLTAEFGKEFRNCEFRHSGGRIVPYVVFPLGNNPGSALAEVILGPRNQTPIEVVQAMLAKLGYGKVEIRRSRASYR